MDAPHLRPDKGNIPPTESLPARAKSHAITVLAQDIIPKTTGTLKKTKSLQSKKATPLAPLLSSLAEEIKKGLKIKSGTRKSFQGKVKWQIADFSPDSLEKMNQFVKSIDHCLFAEGEIAKQLSNIKTEYRLFYNDLQENWKEKVDNILTFQLSYAYFKDYLAKTPLRLEDDLLKGFPAPSRRAWVDLRSKKRTRFDEGEKKLKTGTTVSYCRSQGAKNSQEDRFDAQVLSLGETKGDLIAVYDGHGGQECVNFIQRSLAAHLEEQLYQTDLKDDNKIQKAIERAFQNTQKEKEFIDGTTATVAIRLGSRLFVAHLGDSQAQLIRKNGEVLQLTREQRPGDLELFMRGAFVDGGRIFGQVETGGAFGDSDVPSLIRRPEISLATLRKGDVLRLCSDGLESLTEQEIRGAASPKTRVEIGEATKYDNATDLEAHFPSDLKVIDR